MSLVALTLGLFTTVVLAWCSALLLNFGNMVAAWHGRPLSSAEWWSVSRTETFGGVRYTSTVMVRAIQYKETETDFMLPQWVDLPTPETLGPPFRNEHYEIVEARGWPWPALLYRFSGFGRAQVRSGEVAGGFALEPWSTAAWYSPRVLPFTPIWPGLLGNIAVLSLAWLIVLTGFSEGRRAWRRSQSRCAECGYLLVGYKHERCPECGSAA